MNSEQISQWALEAGFALRGVPASYWNCLPGELEAFAEMACSAKLEEAVKARKAAQIENEALKARLVRADAEKCMAVRQALEAALRPGAPVAWRLWDDEPGGVPAWRYYDQSDFRIGVNPHDFFDSLVPLYTAAPPAQTPYFRVIDEELVSAHLDVANTSDTYEEAKSKLNKLIAWNIQVATDPAVNGGFELKPAQTPPRLNDEQIGMLTVFDGLHHVEVPLLAAYARAIEDAVRRQFGVQE